jgi:exosortase B
MNPLATVLSASEPELAATAGKRAITWHDWYPVAVGLLVLYVPTYLRLASDYWRSDEYAHGPIVLAMSLWLVWRSREALIGAAGQRQLGTGAALLLFGLLSYVLGRSQDIPLMEAGSQLPVLAGAVVLMRGPDALRRLAPAIFFLLFLVPLPGLIIDPLTGHLKQYVSAIAQNALYLAGYPIGRSGVTLIIGPYQLLVADACSGLHSLFSMASVGLLYIYLTSDRNRMRDAVLIAGLLPIGFAANVVRVMVLVLVTYHFGDEAGQGFIHGFSGILLFAVGMLLLFGLEAAFTAVFAKPRAAR